MREKINNLEAKNGWENLTQQHSQKVKDFLQKYFENKFRNDKYDKKYSNEEMEFSGGGVEIMRKIQQGETLPTEINLLYNNGEIIQMHIVFITDSGLNLDVYFKKRALKNYLNFYNTN